MSECSQLTAYNYSNPTVYIVRCTVQHSTVQYSTGQYSTVQYNTDQYNSVYSIVHYGTVQEISQILATMVITVHLEI